MSNQTFLLQVIISQYHEDQKVKPSKSTAKPSKSITAQKYGVYTQNKEGCGLHFFGQIQEVLTMTNSVSTSCFPSFFEGFWYETYVFYKFFQFFIVSI